MGHRKDDIMQKVFVIASVKNEALSNANKVQ